MIDISQISKDMEEKIEGNPDKVIESILLTLNQAKKLRDDYLFNYNILGIEPINSRALGCSSYVLCVTKGVKNA